MQTIRDAWRVGKVVSVLYLDISQAFPNVSHPRLLERMEKMLLHPKIVRWVESFLAEQSTTLTFDDYTSDCIPIPTGVLQGSPLSMILYLIYSSGLLEVSSTVLENKDKILGFIDDTAMIVVSKTIEENLGKLQKLGLEGLEWAQESESKFDMDKY